MRHEGRPYYVGLSRAAELHGASHQAVMEFQVVTNKKMPELHVGRSRIAFYYRKDMEAVSAGIEDRKTDTGRMKVSSVELTALDLLRYPRAAGGIDHIATVLSDLGGKIDPQKLGGKFDSTCPVDRFVARQPRRDVELDAAMYQRSMPQFGSLYLLEQEGVTADRIVGAVKCGDLLQEILPLAAAKATVGGEGPFHCVAHDDLP